METGSKLKYFRSNAGYTQKSAALQLNVPWETYRRYESDSRNIPAKQIREMAVLFGYCNALFVFSCSIWYNSHTKEVQK